MRKTYKPGELAPVSGLYRIIHHTGHRRAHQSLIIRGEALPACRRCGGNVSFEVVHAISHMTHDWDFAGPQGWALPIAPAISELRAFPRQQVELPVLLRSNPRLDAAPIRTTSADISEGGVRLMLDAGAVTAGAPVLVTIQFPEAGELSCTAVLRHQNGLRHGFAFTNLSAAQRSLLRKRLSET